MIHNVAWYFIEAFTSMFEIIIIYTFLDGFLEKKEVSRVERITVFIIAFIQLFIVSSFLYNIPNALIVNFLLVSILLSKMLFKGRFNTHIFTCVLLLAILVVTELASVCVLVFSLNLEAEIFRSDALFKLITVTIKNILSFVAVKIIYVYKKSYVTETSRIYFILLLAIPVISIVVAMIILDLVLKYRITDTFFVLIAYIGLMYVNAIVFSIYEMIMRQLEKNYNYRIIEKQLELQLNHYNKLAENREVLSEVIHDFKNHLNCIYNLYKYDKNNELGNYIKNLINLTDTEKIIDTGNPVIDAVLSEKVVIADKMGIKFERELYLPSNIKIKHTDLCIVLGNSLDNAIEACKRITDSSMAKEIKLSMNYRDKYIIIVITNTCDKPPVRSGRFYKSSKPSPELHGIGLQSIERTVKKYNGNMVIKYDKNMFELEIVMSTA
ncbi:MAG TPA: GHKL domain-containing protein [Clostridiaceae bacterium]|nr:GHKL domain-containing protein [Clostridiaceae bacterium]